MTPFYPQVFGGMIQCEFLQPAAHPATISQLQAALAGEPGGLVQHPHGAVLGLCSFLAAAPHSVPATAPPLLLYLGRQLHSRRHPAAPPTIRAAVQDWRRTHADNWEQHKLAFTEDQLAELTDLLVSPSYYA